MDEPFAVWTGRFQPPHLGHLGILKESLRQTPFPHCVAITSYTSWMSSDSAFSEAAAPSYAAERNPLTEWERMRLMLLLIEGLQADRVIVPVVVPRHDWDWAVVSRFYPPNRVICLTAKDDFEVAKKDLWERRGERVRVVDLPVDPLTTTAIRQRVADGDEWRNYLPQATWSYFEAIDGPKRVFGA